MRLRHVGKGHYAVRGLDKDFKSPRPSPRLPAGARRFWSHFHLGDAERGVVATHEGELVGFFRYNTVNGVVSAAGTWVAVPFRRQGVAQQMWCMAVQRHQPPRGVEVVVASGAGDRFVRSLQRRWSPTWRFQLFIN